MKTALTTRDGRLLARIINLAHRFGCSYSTLSAQHDGANSAATIELCGPADALRRLTLAINKLITDDKETLS